MTTSSAMPDKVSNAVMLLWLSLAISAVVFVWSLFLYFSFSGIIQFAVITGLWAVAIVFLGSRNNLARLAILGVTGWQALNVVLNLGALFSFVGIIGIASTAIAVVACVLLIQSDDWFGSLTSVSM